MITAAVVSIPIPPHSHPNVNVGMTPGWLGRKKKTTVYVSHAAHSLCPTHIYAEMIMITETKKKLMVAKAPAQVFPLAAEVRAFDGEE